MSAGHFEVRAIRHGGQQNKVLMVKYGVVEKKEIIEGFE
jgi:hypothetical protein